MNNPRRPLWVTNDRDEARLAPPDVRYVSNSDQKLTAHRLVAKGPGCVKSCTDVMIVFLNRRSGATDVRLCGRA
jgi:hypothetical protein